MNTSTFKIAALVALVGVLALTGCSATTAPQSPVTDTATAAPAEPIAEPTSVPDPRLEVTIAGVTYIGTEDAPLKIGADTPGVPPAAEATFPAQFSDQASWDVMKAAAIALDGEKYTVLISDQYAPDDFAAQGPSIGYQWGTYRVNEYGTWRLAEGSHSLRTGPYPTKQAATDAPHTLDGRVLDRSEFVVTTVQ